MKREQTSQILGYKKDDTCMSDLAARCGFANAAQAADAYDRFAPVVFDKLAIASQSTESAERLLEMGGALSWVARETPEALFEKGSPRVAGELAPLIFDGEMSDTVASLVQRESLTETSAADFLETVSVVSLAVICGHPETPLTLDSLAATLALNAPNAAVPKATATAAAPTAASIAADTTTATPRAATPTATSTAPITSNDEKSKAGLLVGGLVALLALGGIGLFALGGSGDETETAEATETVTAETDSTTTTTLPASTSDSEPEATQTDADPSDDPPASLASAGEIVALSIPMVDITGSSSDASGMLNFDFNTVTGEVCYSVESINIAGPYRTHIHVGTADESGGIVVDMGALESGATGCVENLPVDTNAILANKAGHYAELHDVSEEFTIRGQLSEATTTSTGGASEVDSTGGGASIVLDGGTVYLEGAVADQATADDMANSLSGIDSTTLVVNNLTIESGAPVPSGRVVITDAIFFDTGTAQVKEIPEDTLSAITELALSRDDWTLTVVGHTDSLGSDVQNLELSLRRATALRDLLAAQGVPDENLRVRGAGETAPIGDNSTDAGRAQNRRIEFEFTPNS